MLNVTLIGDRQLVARLQALPEALRKDIRAKVAALTIQLQARVIRKLSGEVLNVRTGALRRSIQQRVDDSGAAIHGVVYSSGDVKYAAFWEYGFHGTIQVATHARLYRSSIDSKRERTRAQVGSYTRKVNQEARPFLRPSLAEMRQDISSGLLDTVKASMRAQVMGGRGGST